MYPDAGSVLELHAFRTAHHVGRAEGMQLTSGDQERVHGAHISPAADARLGASSLLTSYSVRGGRVCSLKRVDPSKVMSEVSLGGLGLTPRTPPFHRTHGLRRTTCGMARQASGRTIEVESSSLAPRASPRDRVTTPAGREEPGTSLYPSHNDPPDAPRPRQCQGGDFPRLCRAGMAGFRVPGGSQLRGHPS